MADSFRQFDRLSLVARRPARYGIGGEHVSRRRSPSTDFVDYRAYQPGDDFRRIDWNVYGRLGSLQVKVTEGRERLNVLLVLDCSRSMAYGTPDKLGFAGQLIAALAHVASGRADAVQVAMLGEHEKRFGPFRRRHRIPDLARRLSSMPPVSIMDLNAVLLEATPDSHQLVVLVSDLLAPNGVVETLDAWSARQLDVALIHVVSPEEMAPDFSGETELIDAESEQVLELGVTQQTLAAYRARFSAFLDQRAADCRGRGMRYMRVRTDQSLDAAMLDDLRRGGLLR